MAYDNINFSKSNMAVVNTYFYMFDESADLLIQKVSDGDIVNTYPLMKNINAVKSVQYDGYNFWTLHDHASGGIMIRRWQIKYGSIVEVEDEFSYLDDASNTYDSNAFGIEHYITEFDTTASGGSSVSQPAEYYDTTMVSGITLFLGPNSGGESEEVTVSGISFNNVTIIGSLQYTYTAGDQISFYKSLFVFNNYDGVSSSEGTLFRFDAYDGSYMSSSIDVEYKSVTAATFYRLQNVLEDYPDAHTLMYIKNTNAKLRNMSDLINVIEASSVNDSFTGSDGSFPNTTRWEISSGNPRIYSNKLFCSMVLNGLDSVDSNYEMINDFDVQVSGTIGGYSVVSGTNTYDHYMRINFPHNSDYWCEISRNFDDGDGHRLISRYNKGTTTVIQEVTSSGISNYLFRAIKNDNNISFYYKTVISGVPAVSWSTLSGIDMYSNDCSLELGLNTAATTVSRSEFDDLVFNSGEIIYPSDSPPLYGTMNLDNIRDDNATIIPIYDISIVGDNLYRLQDEATYYGTDNAWGSLYSYQLSPIDPLFLHGSHVRNLSLFQFPFLPHCQCRPRR